MLDAQNILKALDVKELPITPMDETFWFDFQFGNIHIHICDSNGRKPYGSYHDPYGFIDDNDIIVRGPKVIIDTLLTCDKFRFYECVEKNGEITANMADMTDIETYQVLAYIQELVWSQPLRLESGLDTRRMSVFKEHPIFLVREGSHTGKMFFFDAYTLKPFWKTTKMVKSGFQSNGYCWFITESGTKYNLTL